MKRGQINTNYQTRYFVLKAGKLSYFEAPKDTEPKGVIDLKGSKLYIDNTNELKISVPNRLYLLRAQSSTERDEWIKAIGSNGATVE
jgi:hypothetical protein